MPLVSPKKLYRFYMPMHSESAQKKPAKHKKTSRGIVSGQDAITLSEKNGRKEENF